MAVKKAILIATIGTRDLAYQDSSKIWLNVGNDRAEDSKSQMGQVKEDLSTEADTPSGLEKYDFRTLTQYFADNFQRYKARLLPIILGKLLQDKCQQIQKIYLVATDQKITVRERVRDTCWAAKVIRQWIEENYKISTEVILQGQEGRSPADFEQILPWWKQTWQDIASKTEKDPTILLCLKGGVNQSSIASQITALDYFGESCRFYDFIEDEIANRKGNPSCFTSPIAGTNYLWDRKQKEAIALLERFDYSGVKALLTSNWENAPEDKNLIKICNLLQLAIQWNIGDLQQFKQSLATAVAKKHFQKSIKRSEEWFWTAYEAAYLSLIRFKQGNIVEALFHSVRAVEGLMSEWAIKQYPDYIKPERGRSPALNKSVCNDARFPELVNFEREFENKQVMYLYGKKLDKLLQYNRPQASAHKDLKVFLKTTRNWRNDLFHTLSRLREEDLYTAWDTKTVTEWEARIVGCLNFLSEQNFTCLRVASLMALVHEELKDAITSYYPTVSN